ncbi:uncharacterized protein EAF02_007779 [Botrytis sinoallii]|uniref:uncharacterized protein n=1 Tax=Botrytis sinoallii TaxID=1463999 RepID=UPI00190041E1|nr:uncharacterized protein EAF02_007779 [Botrytis sinoallii]KAF7880142.1 hypothetical protein EAF02_007779 [Botrytis sinoallii]
MVGPKQTGHSGQREKNLQDPIVLHPASTVYLSIAKAFSAHNNVPVLYSCHSFFAIHALGSLGKSSTPGVDHDTGRGKPVSFA